MSSLKDSKHITDQFVESSHICMAQLKDSTFIKTSNQTLVPLCIAVAKHHWQQQRALSTAEARRDFIWGFV